MANQRLTTTFRTKEQLLELLDEVRELVAADDSFEGMVNWLMPAEGDRPDGFQVEARYRVGNSMGQGGFRIVGDWVDAEDHVQRHVDPGAGL